MLLIWLTVEFWPLIDSSGGDWVRSTESTTPCIWVETATELAALSVAVAVSLYLPSGHWVLSLPLPFQVKG